MPLNSGSLEIRWVSGFLNVAWTDPGQGRGFGEVHKWTDKYGGSFPQRSGLSATHARSDGFCNLPVLKSNNSVGEYLLLSKPICSKQLLSLHWSLPWVSQLEAFFQQSFLGDAYASGIVLECGGVRMNERGSWPHRAYGAVHNAWKYQTTRIGGRGCLPFCYSIATCVYFHYSVVTLGLIVSLHGCLPTGRSWMAGTLHFPPSPPPSFYRA